MANRGALSVSIEMPGFVQYWQDVVQYGPRIVAQEITDALEDNGQTVRDQARKNLDNSRAVDTRALWLSLGVKIHSRPRRYATVGSNLRYAATAENGRKAGKPMPPPGSLDGWRARHNIPDSADYAIRLKISRKGIKARPYLGPALESTKRDQAKRWKRAVRNIGDRTFRSKRRFA